MQGSILLIGNHLLSSNQNQTVVEQFAIRLRNLGWTVYVTSKKLNKFNRIFDMSKTIIFSHKKYEIALVDVFSGQAFIWAFMSGCLLKFFHKPFILILHGGNLPVFAESYPDFVKKLFSWAIKVYSPSPYLKEKLEYFHPNIKIIPNPIEIKKYEFKQRSQISPRIIWLRAFHEIYNPSLVPQVVSKLLSYQIKELEVIMVGPDKGDGSLHKMVEKTQKLKVDQYIKVIPGVSKNQVPIYLNQGDIFINTTNVDNTPVSVIEAMACGLCIVSTNVGGIPYLLEHELDALLVPPDDPEAMAAAVQRILNDPELAARLSTNARKKAEQFDWSIILPQWDQVFEEVLNSNP